MTVGVGLIPTPQYSTAPKNRGASPRTSICNDPQSPPITSVSEGWINPTPTNIARHRVPYNDRRGGVDPHPSVLSTAPKNRGASPAHPSATIRSPHRSPASLRGGSQSHPYEPALQILNPAPCILNPATCILLPAPCILHPGSGRRPLPATATIRAPAPPRDRVWRWRPPAAPNHSCHRPKG